MNPSKMAVAVLVTMVAAAAAIAATAHSRKILREEQMLYPPGTLALGETAEINGATVAVDDAEATEMVASAEMRGFDKRAAVPDNRFVRLTVSIENSSDKPLDVKSLCETLRFTEISTGQPAEIDIVWLRGYDHLPDAALGPGERASGKIAIEVSEFLLAFPFLVEMGDGEARWGVDVIDRDAAIEDFM